MVFDFIKDHVRTYPVENMAKVLGASRAGYYKYVSHEESATQSRNKELLLKIKDISRKSRHIYGSPRVHASRCGFSRAVAQPSSNTP